MQNSATINAAVASATQKARNRLASRYAGQFKLDAIGSADEIEFNDGRILRGKVVDFGPSILMLFAEGGQQMIGRAELKRVDIRKDAPPATRPDQPDVDVTFIERLPRNRSYHASIAYVNGIPVLQCPATTPFPAQGSPVTFVAHVMNKGSQPTGELAFAWQFDGVTVQEGRLPSLAPGEEKTAALDRAWQDGEHTIAFAARPINRPPEISLRNNIRVDRTDALGLVICVSEESYPDYNAWPNMTDSFSFEDWAQFHFDVMNALFEQSIYPNAPQGCLQRVRIDKIARLPEAGFDAQAMAVKRDGHPDGIYFQGAWQFIRWDNYAWRMANVDWGFIHEMGHQLGLIDEYHLNIPTSFTQVKDDGRLVNMSHTYSEAATMMAAHGPVRFSQQATMALNAQLNRPRGFFGDYQYDLPARNTLRVLNRNGAPVAGATLTVYQRQAGSFVTDAPVAGGQTDAGGEWLLPARPTPRIQTQDGFTLTDNPFGMIDPVGSNGLLLVKLQWQGWTEWHWLELPEFNAAALGGATAFTRQINTMLPAQGVIAAPQNFRAVYLDAGALNLSFNPVPGAAGYKLYGRRGTDGWDENPWEALAQTGQTSIPNFAADQTLMYVAVTALDGAGNESGLSEIACAAHMRGITRLVVAPDGARFISDGHPHTGRVIRQNADGTCMDWDVHPPPDLWGRYGGLALNRAGQLLLSNREGGRIQVYDMAGAHVRTVGQPGNAPGQFSMPSGISLDGAGNLCVADTNNDRLQILDAALNPLAQIGGFNKPEGVAWLGDGKLVVADTGNKRVAFLSSASGSWQIVQVADGFSAPVDVARCPDGNIAVADRDAGAVVVLNASGQRVRTTPVGGGPFGLAVQPDGVILAAIPWKGIVKV